MNYKTKKTATQRLNSYRCNGMVFQYANSRRWNFATEGSGVWQDLVFGGTLINPNAHPMYRVRVENVEFVKN